MFAWNLVRKQARSKHGCWKEKLLRIRDVIKLIEAEVWYLERTIGSHRQFKHTFRSGRVTIAGRLDLDLHPKTLKSILKQAGLTEIHR
jgi:predicted RNA binding protein YcfA (HicA-like mRNA interferase family)